MIPIALKIIFKVVQNTMDNRIQIHENACMKINYHASYDG